MKKNAGIAILLASAAWLHAGDIPVARSFEYEKRFGDTRPKPNLAPARNDPSPNLSPLRREARKSPGWQPNGICIVDTSGAALPHICSDGKSGAIICWIETYRGYPPDTTHQSNDIYAQRVDSGGNIVWQSQGVPVCSLLTSNSNYPEMTSDGKGGAIVAWEDDRGGLGYTRVFAQRLDSLGNRLWAENGALVCNQMSGYVDLCNDGHGGAIIAYSDGRNEATTSDDIYAQRIDSAGNPAWPIDGVPVCTADSIQFNPSLVEDNVGGSIITWIDQRDAVYNFYTQRLNSNGIISWSYNGIQVCPVGSNYRPNIISDNNDGAIIGWSNGDIYGQKINSIGNLQWGTSGKIVFSGVGSQGGTNILVSDGISGSVFVWLSSADTSIHAKRIRNDSVTAWGEKIIYDGRGRGWPKLIDLAIGSGNSIVLIWDDMRHSVNYADEYVQKVDSNGEIVWNPTGTPVCTLQMEYETYPQIIGDGLGGAICAWFGDPAHAWNHVWTQRVYADGTPGGVAGEQVKNSECRIQNVKANPNPFMHTTTINYSTAKSQHVAIGIFNITGQLVKTLVNADQCAGTHSVIWNGRDHSGNETASGVYIYRLQAGSQAMTGKIVLLR